MNYITRDAESYLEKQLLNSKITLLLGARQVGKTTLLNRLLSRHHGLLINLDITVDKARLEAVQGLSPEQAIGTLGQPEILIVDEAQRWPELGLLVKGWYDNGVKTKIILSGSSSLNLLDQSAETLTGRNEKIFLPPLTFREVLRSQDWFSSQLLLEDFVWSDSLKTAHDSLLIKSMVFGSYPEAITTTDPESYLLNLSSDYLLKDVLQLGSVKDPEAVRRLLLLLAHQISGEVSVSELSKTLSLSRPTVERYLDLLERSFVIFRLGSYSTNLRKEVAKSKKIYFWDTGIRNALLKEFSLNASRLDIGPLWENWVVAEFFKRNWLLGGYADLYFWRSRHGTEIDLIVKRGEKMEAFEIKWQGRHPLVREAFSSAYSVKPKLVTRDNFLSNIYT